MRMQNIHKILISGSSYKSRKNSEKNFTQTSATSTAFMYIGTPASFKPLRHVFFGFLALFTCRDRFLRSRDDNGAREHVPCRTLARPRTIAPFLSLHTRGGCVLHSTASRKIPGEKSPALFHIPVGPRKTFPTRAIP